MTVPVIRMAGVSYEVAGIQVLQDITLEWHGQSCLVVLGPNGGGKTTWLRLLVGLIEPTVGKVTVLGDAPVRVRHRIGYLPQRPTHLRHYPISVLDFIALGQLKRPWIGIRPPVSDAVAHWMHSLRIESLSTRPLSVLSGGELQRVLLARLLSNQPDMLVLDEPTSAMDPGGESTLFSMVASLSLTIPIVMVTHDLTAIPQIATHIACLNQRLVLHHAHDITTDTMQSLYDFPIHLNTHRHGHDVS